MPQTKEFVIYDEEVKERLSGRLRRIKGQIEGLEKMVQEGRYCVDLLQQIASVHEALRGVGRVVTQNYLERCVTVKIRSKDPEQQKKLYEEMMDVIYKYIR